MKSTKAAPMAASVMTSAIGIGFLLDLQESDTPARQLLIDLDQAAGTAELTDR
jgi:hypothetical protein